MKVGVVGLGLIGGSMAKAVKKKTEHTVLGWDVSETIRYSALLMEAVHGFMEDGNPKDCDLVLLGLYPQLTIEYIKAHAKDFKKGAVVVDCAGVKSGLRAGAGGSGRKRLYLRGGAPYGRRGTLRLYLFHSRYVQRRNAGCNTV